MDKNYSNTKLASKRSSKLANEPNPTVANEHSPKLANEQIAQCQNPIKYKHSEINISFTVITY